MVLLLAECCGFVGIVQPQIHIHVTRKPDTATGICWNISACVKTTYLNPLGPSHEVHKNVKDIWRFSAVQSGWSDGPAD